MINLEGVSKRYNKQSIALDDIHLNVEPGEFVSVVGQSGSGKTTLVKLIIAEERASSGKVAVGDWDITRIPDRHIPLLRRQIGVIFQDFKLLNKKTIYENVAFALQVSGESGSRIRTVIPRLLEIVGLPHKIHAYPHELSGGEQQRVAIARALVHRPKILVADEPTGNLDTINTQDIMEILKKINEFGTTVVLVTHNREIVNQLRKRVVTLDHGKLVSDEQIGKYRL
ncbi:MAG: cell division ATP-binding protein FtsE [Candidatus Magasanikbacteria bacterium RIFCSPHIGHO2_01_FULL_33_34]|uniref:Cell division ATP-binding protein FtsE n=1 Tax=Candidatus Magasanikbacteria bacterium RIFCSPHIGHO2_01_FULL_33_34 TaxID=1798671 RepID=A0A1F6LHK4_9BACT|nr:MAG: cell division ATP-binding protein FtsE [Candidatus Magasanikbacteria bacterium RIFCSPHIGHO2_01_FULL_33_34]OGH65148.1 MAG: cell division ATP-binding protein FtsE [Candidatus Magasanikbacteria bacterium RIFCSPHIGHO2_02_FULL_33_17]OGH75308.1 MAG: cell division ATP-binding protein FtsE [Candidatus Magasanikbacteria bacterium RIFCSPLOWO2_01_FULL_33_34]OGH81715.1 MAG: cell division ATP-binding protein FtsE [Candidatus Magasanikbacteria bacterium RIFCSPLOWO2_12_FULL_34_7]